jgi:hypothetical protein
MLVLVIFSIIAVNETNSTLECPANYYGDDEGSPQDLLLRDPMCELNEISPPR